MVPVLMQTPPITSRRSIRATRFPVFAPWIAALCPAGPEPITTKSYSDISDLFVESYSREKQPDQIFTLDIRTAQRRLLHNDNNCYLEVVSLVFWVTLSTPFSVSDAALCVPFFAAFVDLVVPFL